MPKTTEEVWDDLDISTQQSLMYNDRKLALNKNELYYKWYSEQEVEQIRKEVQEEERKKAKKEVLDEIMKSIIKASDLMRKNKYLSSKKGKGEQ